MGDVARSRVPFVIGVLSDATLAIEWNARIVVLLLASNIVGQGLPQWSIGVAGGDLGRDGLAGVARLEE